MTKISSPLALITVILVLTGLNSCSPGKEQNVILITLDTQRADHISSYDTQFAHTPNLDSLAKQGFLFEQCYSPIPITLPAHASIFYSQLPSQLQVYNNGDVFTGEDKESLAEIFQSNGYVTGAIVSLGVMKGKFGLNKGFETYDDDFPREKWYLTATEVNHKAFKWLESNRLNNFFLWIHYSDPHGPYSPPGEPPDLKIFMNDTFQKDFYLDKNRKEELDLHARKGKNILRFEVSNAFYDENNANVARLDMFEVLPHSEGDTLKVEFGRGVAKKPHRGGPNIFLRKKAYLSIIMEKEGGIKLKFRGRLMLRPAGYRAMYKKEVEYMDQEIGQLLARIKSLGLQHNTAIVVVGDHGEGLGEHLLPTGNPHIGHIHFLTWPYLEVPFLVQSPYLKSNGKRIAASVSIVDVSPTILGLLGWRQPDQMEGRNALKLGKRSKEPPDLFGETYEPQAFDTSFCLIKYPWQLIIIPKHNTFELFDLSRKSLSRKNHYAEANTEQEIVDMRARLFNYTRASLANKLPDRKKDKDTLEMLKSLGYIKQD